MNSQVERTLVLIKPDGVQRGLIGEVIKRFEQRAIKIVALKMIKPSLEAFSNHYPSTDEWFEKLGEKGFKTFADLHIDAKEAMGTEDRVEVGKQVKKWLVNYMTQAPIVAIVLEGIHAVSITRKIVGPTLPSQAEIGTIRGDFSADSPAAANLEKRAVKNVVHASESKAEAEREIYQWFSEEEIFEWERPDHKVMY